MIKKKQAYCIMHETWCQYLLYSPLPCSQVCEHYQHAAVLCTWTINWYFILDLTYVMHKVYLNADTFWNLFGKLYTLYGKSTLSLLQTEQFHHETEHAMGYGWKCSTRCKSAEISIYVFQVISHTQNKSHWL